MKHRTWITEARRLRVGSEAEENKAVRFLLMKAHPTRKYHATRDKQFSCPLRLEAQDTALSRR